MPSDWKEEKFYLDMDVQEIWPMTSDKPMFFLSHSQRWWTRHLQKQWKSKIIGGCDICSQFSKIHNVLLVDGLKHNLLTIRQLWQRKSSCFLIKYVLHSEQQRQSNSFVAKWNENVYIMNFDDLNKQNVFGALRKIVVMA